MSELINYTKEELVKAMQLYNSEAINNSNEFAKINESIDCARDQVENLLAYLSLVRINKLTDDTETAKKVSDALNKMNKANSTLKASELFKRFIEVALDPCSKNIQIHPNFTDEELTAFRDVFTDWLKEEGFEHGMDLDEQKGKNVIVIKQECYNKGNSIVTIVGDTELSLNGSDKIPDNVEDINVIVSAAIGALKLVTPKLIARGYTKYQIKQKIVVNYLADFKSESETPVELYSRFGDTWMREVCKLPMYKIIEVLKEEPLTGETKEQFIIRVAEERRKHLN